MILKKWEKLPAFMQIPEVRPYYDRLKKKQFALLCKRLSDIILSLFMLIALMPVFLVLAIAIKIDSRGPVFYRQIRVTQYGKMFRIHKFRSMRVGADQSAQVTVSHDERITRVGRWIRKVRLDEISQLLDVLSGNMTFVGTRPEAVRFVQQYRPEYYATLLLPAGITSEASIQFRNEEQWLGTAENAEATYMEQILPVKMQQNLESIKKYGFWRDVKTLFKTMAAVLKRSDDPSPQIK